MSQTSTLLVIPRVRVQNANAISSPMTWGFPAMSAFIGLMHALERKLTSRIDLVFEGVGVICHSIAPQVTEDGYTRAFHLSRNPVGKDGKTASIVEEGRAHLEVTLVFDVGFRAGRVPDEHERDRMAQEVADIVAGMRIAGGSVIPHEGVTRPRPELITLAEDPEERHREFRKRCRRWLPGFALVARDDLLQARLAELRATVPGATVLDAWLDMSRLNIEPETIESTDRDGAKTEKTHWHVRRSPGWIVPIPIGYGAISRLYQPGEVARARDSKTPFRFVESLYSLGEWISPHRLQNPDSMFWYADSDAESGVYRCRNDYALLMNP